MRVEGLELREETERRVLATVNRELRTDNHFRATENHANKKCTNELISTLNSCLSSFVRLSVKTNCKRTPSSPSPRIGRRGRGMRARKQTRYWFLGPRMRARLRTHYSLLIRATDTFTSNSSVLSSDPLSLSQSSGENHGNSLSLDGRGLG